MNKTWKSIKHVANIESIFHNTKKTYESIIFTARFYDWVLNFKAPITWIRFENRTILQADFYNTRHTHWFHSGVLWPRFKILTLWHTSIWTSKHLWSRFKNWTHFNYSRLRVFEACTPLRDAVADGYAKGEGPLPPRL